MQFIVGIQISSMLWIDIWKLSCVWNMLYKNNENSINMILNYLQSHLWLKLYTFGITILKTKKLFPVAIQIENGAI